jgi:hypothetical protein
VTALVRYLLADLVRSQRWVAPMAVYLLLVGIVAAGGGPPVSTGSVLAAPLFPLAAWLAWVAAGCEDPVLETVTATAAGGLRRARLGKLLTGMGAAGALGLVPLALTMARAPRQPQVWVAVGLAVAANVVGGAAVGFACARPVVPRRGLSVVLIGLVTVVEIIVPGLPPVRATLQLLAGANSLPAALAGMAAIATMTAVGATALVAATLAVTVRRA